MTRTIPETDQDTPDPQMSTATIDAHFPNVPPLADPVYASTWNPITNQWEPSNPPVGVPISQAYAEPMHGDVYSAQPMVNAPGDPRTYPPNDPGTTPDARLNLLDSVRGNQSPGPQTINHVHYIHTEEHAADLVRMSLIAVGCNGTPTVLLEENTNRGRALVSVFTATSTVLVYPLRQGNIPQLTAAPTLPGAFWPLVTGDPNFEIKGGAGVEALGVGTTTTVILVRVIEEIRNQASVPGLT